jgi:hypothetical protein
MRGPDAHRGDAAQVVTIRKPPVWGMFADTQMSKFTEMQAPLPFKFEVASIGGGRFAVFINQVRIAVHKNESDALAHCARLRNQAELSKSEQ